MHKKFATRNYSNFVRSFQTDTDETPNDLTKNRDARSSNRQDKQRDQRKRLARENRDYGYN